MSKPMTLEERKEAARDAYDPDFPDMEAAIRAAFPELFITPPSAWLAPMRATKQMQHAGGQAICSGNDCECDGERIYAAMRDAHLNKPETP